MRKGLSFLMILSFAAGAWAVEIDLSEARMQRIAPNTIRLSNVNVPGHGNCWVDFVWDPQANLLRAINAEGCKEEFDPASRQADWQDTGEAVPQ